MQMQPDDLPAEHSMPMQAMDPLAIGIAGAAVVLSAMLFMLKGKKKSVNGSSAVHYSGPSRGPMLILWGSQTGTAEAFASTLQGEARQHGYAARSVDMEDYDAMHELPEEPAKVVFLLATGPLEYLRRLRLHQVFRVELLGAG